MNSTEINRTQNPGKHFRYIILFFLPLILGFTLRGCGFLEQLFSVVNYGNNQNYNDVVKGIEYYYYVTNGGNIYRTSGDEDPWELQFTATGNPDLLDVDEDFPWVYAICVGNNGTILRLPTFTEQWEFANSNVTVNLNKILTDYYSQVISDDLDFVVGDNGTVLKSSDHGKNWTQISFPTTDNLYDITKKPGETKIFVSGENYCFYSSTDDGTTWIPEGPRFKKISGPFGSYNKIYFYDDSIGYVGGPNGLVLKTTDGGSSWKTKVAPGFNEVNDLFFISPDSGAAVGPNGVVRLTTDGGDNWFEDTDLTAFLNGETIKNIVPFGTNYGLLIGENGFDIFVAKDSTYLDSLPLVTDVEYKDILFDQFHVLQNYPNPFNPITKIRYQIPELSFITLKVYDVLGNEIEILVNEQKHAGNYEVSFNASELPSGVYFYQLNAGDFVETRKMILLR